MERELALALKKGDMIKIRSRQGYNLGVIREVRIYENGYIWGDFKWIGSPGGCAGDMTSDLISKVDPLGINLPTGEYE